MRRMRKKSKPFLHRFDDWKCGKRSADNWMKNKPERILKFLFSSSASELSPALLTCKTLIFIPIKLHISTDRNQCKS